ncbi:TonB-dependent receptor domain-containing protein [Phenylobacterium soli]|uniref:TonB-dependent receptor domain-containing protein n=1 Tax=Phenylobacterium soli TaxID=2170551 RepID=UPI001402CDC8|nr:TonB-dependent receptor [Phenylobacterium soli]
MSEIVVTGSRIRRPDFVSPQPLDVVTSETIDQRGFTNVADALNELPSMGVPINPVGDQGSFGTGRQYVNLFSLGTNRTLTLVNGRRFVSANVASIFTGASAGAQVDLNAIPTGLIDRIETVQAGGSAVYGSEAIAGVVNIITKDHYDGVEFDGQYGVSDQGDGEEYRARIIAGRSFMDERLNVYGSYEYNKTTALAYTDRKYTAQQLTFANNPANTGANDGIPGNIIWQNRRVPETNLGGIPFRTGGSALSGILTIVDASGNRVPAQFAPDGTLVPYSTGTFIQAATASGGNGLNLAELTSLVSPVERHVVSGFGTFRLTDHIKLKGEGFYTHLESTEPFNQPIFNAPVFGGNSASLRMSTSNPFLSAQARTAILNQPTALPADTASPGDRLFFLSRSSVDIGPNRTHTVGETGRGVIALEGDFDIADRHFYWDASANYGKSWGYFESTNIDQSKFLLAIDAVRDASGAIVCRDATARAAGCAPLNLFGQGAPSAAALKYVNVHFQSDYTIEERDYLANLGGDIVNLPAGPLSVLVGAEWRKESSSFEPNDPQRNGVGRSAAITALDGSFTSKEWYGEATLPVFGKDFGFLGMRSLEFDGQYRRVDNSQAGKNNAWSYGARWRPFEDLLIRGSRSQSFRAPAITELFLPQATSFTSATDPCDKANINGGPNPAARKANCQAAFQALGLPAGYQLTSQVQSATVQGTTSGSQDLKNEIARQDTLGVVYQPHFVHGLTFKFDWMKIDITHAISNFTLSSILQVCYDSPSAPADACSRFQRGTSASARPGQILGVGEAVGNGTTSTGPRTGFINAGYTNFEGYTWGVNYNLDLGDIPEANGLWNGNPGTLEFSVDFYHISKLETSVTGLGFDLNNDKGEIGNASDQWRAQVNYSRDPLSVTWTTSFIGRSLFNRDFTFETRYPLSVADYYRNDVAVTYDITSFAGHPMGLDKLQARLVVKNVFNAPPPYGAATSANGIATYDMIGRYYEVGLKARF